MQKFFFINSSKVEVGLLIFFRGEDRVFQHFQGQNIQKYFPKVTLTRLESMVVPL